MNCPKCKGKSVVTEVDKYSDYTRRRKKCIVCDYRYTTYETMLKSKEQLTALERRVKQSIKVLELVITELTK